MLLSAINMKLRDSDLTLDELLEDEEISLDEVTAKLVDIGYAYDESRRAFVAT